MSRRPAVTALPLIVVVLAASGCTATKDTPAPEGSAATTETSAAAYQPVTRQVQAEGDTLAMTVGPLIRSGTTVVLTAQTSITKNKGEPGPVIASAYFSQLISNAFDGGRVIDEQGGRVWEVATLSGGDNQCVCTGLMRLEPGETKPLQAAFANVPEDVTRLSVMLPWAGVFTDIPVVAGTVPTPPPGKDKSGTEHLPLDLGTVGASATAGLEAYTERLDVALATRRTPARVDLILDADVLFKLDSAQLTSAAAKAVGAAVEDIERAGPGALTVTGHTDDSGTTAHNQRLSEQRAGAVATALTARLPDAQWPKTVAGKGESEPAGPNTSEASRRLNRRVSITYQPSATSTAPSGAPSPSSAAALPATKGVVGSGADGVTVTLPDDHGTVRFEPRSVTARSGNLLVELVARNVGGNDVDLDQYLGSAVRTARGEFDPQSWFGTSGVRLLAGSTAYYGLDYPVTSGSRRCLCDRALARRFPPGSERVLPLWFPGPATTTGTVTIDVPDHFRITDVPIG